MGTSEIDVTPTLRVENLTIAYRFGRRWLDAVREVSLTIAPGQTVGLVGESGSGKTTLALAVMRYLDANGRVRAGRIEFEGRDLLALGEEEMRDLWGHALSLVPQNPLSALNPAIPIGEQVAEGLRLHLGMDATAARARTLELLRMVRLPDPERVAVSYPHQISGGMQQRVLIAIALSAGPRLLVLDEPTTSLDVTTQASILDLLRDLIQARNTAVLYVTHNLGVVAQLCDRVAVLYAGELVEDAPMAELFQRPLHPYTHGLLASVPRVGQSKAQQRLLAIPGHIPPLDARPAGCAFAPRCPLAIERCRERPPLFAAEASRQTRCWRWEEVAAWGKARSEALEATFAEGIAGRAEGETPRHQRPAASPPVLETRDLAVHFTLRRSLADLLRRRPVRRARAVDGVSLTVGQGRIVGLVGESGSGKTTLARAILGLEERTGGAVELFSVPLPPRLAQRDRETLRHLQMVFQNPEEALNPYRSIGDSLRRPLMTLAGRTRREADALVEQLLAAVRLPAAYAHRRPDQLSGGEKQRVAIARAFASNPDLLIADEPVSSLDVSVQASILNLLADLQSERGSAMLFISHDLAVVSYLADTIAVMCLGHVMEVADAAALFIAPHHPYTEALLSAIPVADPGIRQERIRLEGDVPGLLQVQGGCPFHTRCPRRLGDLCATQLPPWRVDEGTGKRYLCHIPPEELAASQRMGESATEQVR